MIEQYCVDLTPDLGQQLLNLRREDTRVRQHRSWQNPPTKEIPGWMLLAFEQVSNYVGDYLFKDWWANISFRSHETRWHNHPQYDRVAVLYVSVPGGNIEFETGESLLPNSGDLLVFSANLAHQVCPNSTDNPRISLAFNYKKKR